jgi:hypothetical protein
MSASRACAARGAQCRDDARASQRRIVALAVTSTMALWCSRGAAIQRERRHRSPSRYHHIGTDITTMIAPRCGGDRGAAVARSGLADFVTRPATRWCGGLAVPAQWRPGPDPVDARDVW